MTALAGIWSFDGRPDADGDCARMLAAQEIYGPHDKRQWRDGSLVMGRQLFRSLPEDIYDRQPLQTGDGRLTLVADLRLDNRDELVVELGLSSQGPRLCDAAILLEAFDRWGERVAERLVGDFAFALWDAKAYRLLLGRDFLGQRPLHYHRGCGFFAFASMPKGLHAIAEIPYGPDEQFIAEWLVWMPRRGPRSFFRDIARVEPGHLVIVTPDGISSRKYWQPKGPNGARLRSSDYVEGLRHHLDRATQSRLRGVNGAVATHLSAGLDSSAVTATAARLLAPRGGKVVAFTAVPRAGYENPGLKYRLTDEGPLAAMTAAMYPNVEHVLIRSERQSLLDGLDRAFHLSQCPVPNLFNFAWGSAINQAIRDRKLNILLTGDMGNTTATHNGIDLLPELLLAGRFIRLWREARALLKTGYRRRRGVLLDAFGAFMPGWLWLWASKRFRGASWNIYDLTVMRPGRFAELDLPRLARARGLDFSGRPGTNAFATRLWGMSGEDSGDVFKGMLAGWGVDWRDPLADKRLTEYCLSIPTDEYLFDGVPRALAKRALSDRLPQAVLNERRRGYQAADWHESLIAARGEVAGELDRLAACTPAQRALDIEQMKRLVENLPSSGWERNEIIQKYRFALLSGISAGHFLRRASGAN